jgi:hypothetical protein
LIEDSAQRRDLHREVGFLDRSSEPHSREDLVFSNHLTLPFDQQSEETTGA